MDDKTTSEDHMTSGEAAEYLGVSPSTIYRWRKSGFISEGEMKRTRKDLKVGGYWWRVWPRSEIEEIRVKFGDD